jgi:uncharacterized phage protein (TIGR01671 family)
MRAIKFRAWNKKGRLMIDNVLYSSEWEELCFVTLGTFAWRNKEEFEIMQYTGLKDKNGIAVYEGDIIESDQHVPPVMKIDFIEGAFCAYNDMIGRDWCIDINHFYPSSGCCFEVIGNIYENPELLKGET